ncbi:hypothetical protein [Pseudomonas typographi]|uniref:hypothetical protein n=1 Tax=Pseudomonas typographi TaxID=2715964 RepID=UPI001688B4FE|nr:hypothetical protein [Pseudomonas typographi]MBD1555225.1 hypothetical protein [Pseudomonas typographi]
MEHQIGFSNPWEESLVAVARQKLEFLRDLDSDTSGETTSSDVGSALSSLGAITDLIYEEGFQFSDITRTQLQEINENAMQMMRERAARPREVELQGDPEHEAAVALYEAILSNLPTLATGETSGHALALSKAMYRNLADHCADRPGFDAAKSVICVHDFRAMQLAGRPAMRL